MNKGILIDVENKKSEVVEFEPKLEVYYKLLNCTYIDITARKIGENWFDIVCDDEGLLENKIPSAVNSENEVQLVGNLLLVNHDGEGNETSLTDEQIKDVLDNHINFYIHNNKITPILIGVEWE
jgi:hypothetical protein